MDHWLQADPGPWPLNYNINFLNNKSCDRDLRKEVLLAEIDHTKKAEASFGPASEAILCCALLCSCRAIGTGMSSFMPGDAA